MATYTHMPPLFNRTVVRRDEATVPWDDANSRPRDINGAAGRQWVADGSPAPTEYAAPAPTDEETRTSALLADTDRQNLINAIKTATPAQIKAFINAQVTDLASAKVMLQKLTLLVALSLRD